jgi:uncharacterized membrane protein
MESLLLPLGLLGIAAFIGGVVGFFSLFSSGDKESRMKALERESAKLGIEINKLNAQIDALRESFSTHEPQDTTTQAAALKASGPTATINPLSKVPELIVEASFELETAISEDDLVKQALAANDLETQRKPVFVAETKPTINISNRQAIKPAEPNFIEKGFAYAKNWLFGGNTLVRSGIVILFIGISFLIKYAAEHTHVPIELRLAGIALSGLGLLTLGWRLRIKRTEYSWALQGGGIGVLYLTIFAALKLYQLIPAQAAFALLIAIAVLSALIAVLQSAMPLAILGFTGGFLAPILTSSGGGSHVGLFSYYLVLNLGIAFVAYHKSWRPLNVLGFAFTFIIGTLWGVKSYTPEYFLTTEPFLIIHFLLFTAIAVLYAHRQSTKASDYVDATLVFGTPIVGFSLQYALLRDSHFGLAYSALALGVFYIGLAWWVFTRKRDTLKFLGECFLALGVGFITLTLPLALDGRWTSAAWAVEGIGLLWVGLRQSRSLPALSGLALQLLAAIAFTKGWGLTGYSGVGHQNMFLGVVFIAMSGWACGALLNQYRTSRFSALSTPLAFWGWAWWIGAGLTAIDEFLPATLYMHAGLAFVALTSTLLPSVSRYFKWSRLANLAALLLPSMVIVVIYETLGLLDSYSYDRHPFASYGYLAWPLALVAYAWLISKNAVPNKAWLRAPLLWITAIIGVFEWQYQLGKFVHESNVWQEVGWAIIPILIIAAVTRWQFNAKELSSEAQLSSARIWAWIGGSPLMAFLVLWFILMSLNSNGYAAPLPYVPFVNPLDITLSAALLLLLIWQRGVTQHLNRLRNINPILAGIMSFTLLNGILLRTLHHWAGTPFQWTSLFSNSTVQMSFTFLWGITAFALMLLAHKQVQRQLWIIGASLMGVTVAKIFLLDMAQTGSVERIISFIGAGLMLLVMGYFAPLPPATAQTQTLEPA